MGFVLKKVDLWFVRPVVSTGRGVHGVEGAVFVVAFSVSPKLTGVSRVTGPGQVTLRPRK